MKYLYTLIFFIFSLSATLASGWDGEYSRIFSAKSLCGPDSKFEISFTVKGNMASGFLEAIRSGRNTCLYWPKRINFNQSLSGSSFTVSKLGEKKIRDYGRNFVQESLKGVLDNDLLEEIQQKFELKVNLVNSTLNLNVFEKVSGGKLNILGFWKSQGNFVGPLNLDSIEQNNQVNKAQTQLNEHSPRGESSPLY